MSEIITGDSKEAVAYGLLLCIASAEEKSRPTAGAGVFQKGATDKEWILATYRECLAAVEDRVT